MHFINKCIFQQRPQCLNQTISPCNSVIQKLYLQQTASFKNSSPQRRGEEQTWGEGGHKVEREREHNLKILLTLQCTSVRDQLHIMYLVQKTQTVPVYRSETDYIPSVLLYYLEILCNKGPQLQHRKLSLKLCFNGSVLPIVV